MNQDEDARRLFEFEIRHWPAFDEKSTALEEDSFTLEHTALFDEYSRLFDRKFLNFLTKRGLSIQELYAVLDKELKQEEDKAQDKVNADLTPVHKVMRILTNLTDFKHWASEMKKAARQQREMNDVD
jgi:hypothetical protein